MSAPGDAQITRARIVNAAVTLFAERGFDGVSTRDLGERASCNIATLNYHFGGKQKLYSATVEEVYRRLRAQLVDALAPLDDRPRDPARLLPDLVERFYAALRKEREGVRLILREVLDRGHLSGELETELVLPNLDAAEAVIGAMFGIGRDRARQALVAASFLAGRYAMHDDAALARSFGVATIEEAHATARRTLTQALSVWLTPPA